MSTKQRKILAAISIRFKNMIGSPAIKVTLVIAVIASCLLSFFPAVRGYFVNDEIIIYTDTSLDLTGYDKKIAYSEDVEEADIVVTYRESDDIYTIRANTQDGYNAVSVVSKAVQEELLKKNIQNGSIQPEVVNEIMGGTIRLEIDESIVEVDDSTASFLMMLTMIFFLVMTLLVSRIGTQVAFEKGNKITETILTSIPKEELYFAQVTASVLLSIVSFFAASLPMIIAYIIDDSEITTDFSFLTFSNVVAFLFHLITISVGLIILSVGVGSWVKKAEDANVITILILIPTLVSYAYYILTFDIYRGFWMFLNYIPLFSVYSVFGGLLRGTFSVGMVAVFFIVDIVFVVLCYQIMKKVFCKYI